MAVEISDVDELQAMSASLTGSYVLVNDIDASATVGWNAGQGFAPIGATTNRFTGTLDGQGHTITGMYINRAVANVALFAAVGAATLRGFALAAPSITAAGGGASFVAGNSAPGTVLCEDLRVTGGTLANSANASASGGVLGSGGGTVRRCVVDADISAKRGSVGGIVVGAAVAVTVEDCRFFGDVDTYDTSSVGASAGIVRSSAATASLAHVIRRCAAVWSITGATTVNLDSGVLAAASGTGATWTVEDCYARFVKHSAGTAVGVAHLASTSASMALTRCYAALSRTAGTWGSSSGVCNNSSVTTEAGCFWDTTVGPGASAVGTGKTTTEMQTLATYTGASWDMVAGGDHDGTLAAGVWWIAPGAYPQLWHEYESESANVGTRTATTFAAAGHTVTVRFGSVTRAALTHGGAWTDADRVGSVWRDADSYALPVWTEATRQVSPFPVVLGPLSLRARDTSTTVSLRSTASTVSVIPTASEVRHVRDT